MTEIIQPIPARIKNVAIGGHVAGTEDIIDDTLGKTQQTINQEVDNKIEALTSQDIEVVSALPAVGDADPKKIYRVTGTTSYTDYMLNPAGTAFSQLATFSFPGIDDEPTAGSDNLVKSKDIAKFVKVDTIIGTLNTTVLGGSAPVTSGTIVANPSGTYGFYYAPVVKGRKYIIHVSGVLLRTAYIAVAFSDVEPENGVTVTALKTVEQDKNYNYDFEYVANANGFLLQYNQSLTSGAIKIDEYKQSSIGEVVNSNKIEVDNNLKILKTSVSRNVEDVAELKGSIPATSNIIVAASGGYGFKYIQVIKGNEYIIEANAITIPTGNYLITAFSRLTPAGGVYVEPLQTKEDVDVGTFRYEFVAEEDGYLLQYNQSLTSGSIIFTEISYEDGLDKTMQRLEDVETSQSDIYNTLSTPIENPIIDVDIWKGFCAASSGEFRIGVSTWGFKYIPVVSGNSYKVIADNVALIYPQYAAIAFSTIVPVDHSRGVVLKTVDTGSGSVSYTFEYTAVQDGYLMVYNHNLSQGSIAFFSIDNSLERTMQRIEDLEQGAGETGGIPRRKLNIVCSGSSITWGGGTNGVLDSSMVKYIDSFLKETYAKTLLADSAKVSYSNTPTVITNTLLYGGSANMLEGNGASVEFDLFGDEVAICQMKRRSDDYGLMKVTADGVQIGVFDNRNNIQTNEETFTGTNLKEIKLSFSCTFNHRIYINGSDTPLDSVIINDKLVPASIPSNCDAWVFRGPKTNGAETCHYIQFADSLGDISSVRVIYDYGRIIAHERSTIGQLTDDEYANESFYGKSNVSYDPANPTTGIGGGIEFRAIDDRAFFVHKFTEAKNRHYKIEIIGGENPYFIFNFATNRYHNLMNAGIGGWQLSDLLSYSGGMNNYTQFFKYYRPDIIFEEAMTNDDWESWGAVRRISRSIGEVTLTELQKMHQLEVSKITYNSSTNNYAVEMCTGIINSITPTSLISSDIVGTATQVGDIIRIGNYHGDMQQVTCRKITEVNTATGEVRWLEPITAYSVSMIDDIQDLVGAEINIRNIEPYKAKYVELINKIHAISPATKIVVVHNGLPNLWTRQLWGYEIVHAELAKEHNNVEFVDAQQHILDTMNRTISGNRHEVVTSTGVDTYVLTFQGTQYKGWQGFKVLVNGVDVYGKDAYVEMAMAYRLKDTYSGASVNKTSPYDRSKCDWVTNGVSPFTLHFIKNVPAVDDTIEVQYADTLWSGDFCHVQDVGAQAYAESYKEMLDKL